MKNVKAGSPSNGPFLLPLSTESHKSNFHKRKSSFLHWQLLDDLFVQFGRLLENERKRKNKIKEKEENEKMKINEKTGKKENMETMKK